MKDVWNIFFELKSSNMEMNSKIENDWICFKVLY